MAFVYVRFSKGTNAVAEHPFTIGVYQAGGPTSLIIFNGSHLVQAMINKKVWPRLKPVTVYACGISGIELVNFFKNRFPHALKPHMTSISVPEPSHRCFRRTIICAFNIDPPHLHDAILVGGTLNASLNETANRSILHRYKP